MDPFMVVPGRPVAAHEVSVSVPMQSNHRRNRHPPLLHATEWMKAMYHKENCPPVFKNDTEINGEGDEEAELLPKEVAKPPGPSLAEKRRGMIYTPQALRPDTSASERETSESSVESSLKQSDDSTALEGEVDLCEDGEVSPRDVSRPLFTTSADKRDEPTLPKEKRVKALAPSPRATKLVSTTTDNTRGAGFPRIDYGPVGKHTALHSHRPSEEERKHSVWLGEGWKVWRSHKMVKGCRDGNSMGNRGKGSDPKAGLKPLRRGVKGLFGCM